MESEQVLIHVRFAPNGVVVEIGERPKALSPQEWYDLLCEKAGTAYQPLAGGRAVFKLTRAEVEALQSNSASGAV